MCALWRSASEKKKKERKGVKCLGSAQFQQSCRFMLYGRQAPPPTAFSNLPLAACVRLRMAIVNTARVDEAGNDDKLSSKF